MYIIKNALKCIGRSMGRNVLIGIITLVIAISACVGLSIRQAAENAKEETLKGLTVTATIAYDRLSSMGNMGRPDSQSGGRFDREQFAQMMGEASNLTLEEYNKYAAASTVKEFRYTLSAYFDGSDSFSPVTTETETNTETNNGSSKFPQGNFGGGFNGNGANGGGFDGMRPGAIGGGMMSTGDFTIIGYSSESAMSEFQNGTATMSSGTVFAEGTTEKSCLISEELALFNDVAVGSTIIITNPNSETETYELNVVGIYKSTESNDLTGSMFGVGQDPANRIFMSSAALQTILDASKAVSTTVTVDGTDREYETAVTGSLSGTYVFANVDDYYTFEQEVRTMGLSESYTVSSNDIKDFENSLTPLNTLSEMASWFLLVILAIGAIILVVLNIFNIRERKYEIGVLTAMGMKKGKVALQFITEILVVTMLAVIIGAGVGAVSSVPVTNALLENQIESQQTRQNDIELGFGKPGNMPSTGGNFNGGFQPDRGDNSKNPFGQMMESAVDYVSEVDSAMNLTVVFQMIGIGLLLTLVAGFVSVLFVMRYDPLKILANRD